MYHKMILNKKAIELSINFIVMLILTLVVFGASMMIAQKILEKGGELKEGLDRQTEERLASLLTSGNEEVMIAFNKKEAKRKDSVVFGVGILNNLRESYDFKIYVSSGIGVNRSGGTISNTWDNSWAWFKETTVGQIKNNDYRIISIHIITGDDVLDGATYVFNVEVKYDINSTGDYISYPAREPIKKIRVKII